MKKTNTKITRYTDGEFIIDIVINKHEDGETMFEAWLQHEKYGVSEMMFGAPQKQTEHEELTYKEFVKWVEANLPNHEAIYTRDRMEEEEEFDEVNA